MNTHRLLVIDITQTVDTYLLKLRKPTYRNTGVGGIDAPARDGCGMLVRQCTKLKRNSGQSQPSTAWKPGLVFNPLFHWSD
jgi:hypothetical protein